MSIENVRDNGVKTSTTYVDSVLERHQWMNHTILAQSHFSLNERSI